MKILKYSLIVLSMLLLSCKERHNYNGYLDVDLINLSSDYPGRLVKLYVKRGQIVNAITEAFIVEQTSENIQTKINEEALLGLLAEQQQVLAELNFNENNFKRIANMRQHDASSQTDYEKAREVFVTSKEKLNAISANIKQAKQRIKLSKWQATRKTNLIKNPAIIYDTYALPGEFVTAGTPIVSVIKPNNIKAIFFVPEPELAAIKIDSQITIKISDKSYIPANVSYISPIAEFTSPILYSDSLRQKLVFRIEARIDLTKSPLTIAQLHLGQPITIEHLS
jgi:HlyD family secretion protein